MGQLYSLLVYLLLILLTRFAVFKYNSYQSGYKLFLYTEHAPIQGVRDVANWYHE